MCVNYKPPLPEQMDMVLGVLVDPYRDCDRPSETWKDYQAPVLHAGGRPPLQIRAWRIEAR